jgi:hypothetical protein
MQYKSAGAFMKKVCQLGKGVKKARPRTGQDEDSRIYVYRGIKLKSKEEVNKSKEEVNRC